MLHGYEKPVNFCIRDAKGTLITYVYLGLFTAGGDAQNDQNKDNAH
jgi:hypothetical protein